MLDVRKYDIEGKMPMTQEEIYNIFASGDETVYAELMTPFMNKDAFGRIRLCIDGVNSRIGVIHSEEKARYTATMNYVYSLMVSQIDKFTKLISIADRGGARSRKDVHAMYKNLHTHFMQYSGNSIVQLIMQLFTLSRPDVTDEGCARAMNKIWEIRDLL